MAKRLFIVAAVGVVALVVLGGPLVYRQYRAWRIEGAMEQLSDEDPAVRREAAEALGSLKPDDVSALVGALDDADWSVSQEAAQALGKLGRRGVEPVLATLVHSDGSWTRPLLREPPTAQLLALECAGESATEALEEFLRNESREKRLAAALILYQLHSHAIVVEQRGGPVYRPLPGLAEALGAHLPIVIEALTESLKNEDVQEAASRGLAHLDRAGIPALVHALEGPSTARVAGPALGNLGQHVVPPLIELMQQGEPDVRALAAQGVESVFWVRSVYDESGWPTGIRRPVAEDVVPVLTELLDDESAEVRRSAAAALEEIGPEASQAAPALERAMEDEDERVRQAASRALRRIGS